MEEYVLGTSCPSAAGVGLLLRLLLAASVYSRASEDEAHRNHVGLRSNRLIPIRRRLYPRADGSQLGIGQLLVV